MNPHAPRAAATRVLTRGDVAALMSPQDYLDAVRDGFAALAQGHAVAPEPLHVASEHGGFHAKAASYSSVLNKPARSFVALKFNANMPGNGAMFGLPTIQGALLLCNSDNGQLLAVMDSTELTLRRTAAATALAAQHLARPDAATLAVCGCGAQALPQVEALLQVLPLRRIRLWDIDSAKSHALRDVLVARGGLDVAAAASVREATGEADVIVTCTVSRTAWLSRDDVRPGTFIAAVGADSPSKSEVAPGLMAAAKVVVDSIAQCAVMGDLHHAVAAGAMRADQVHAELGQLVLGTRPGRSARDEICIFDSTGVAVQDAASAAMVYARANERGVGALIDFAGDGPAPT